MNVNISIQTHSSPLVPLLNTPQQPLPQLPSLTPRPTWRPPLLFAPASELRFCYSHLDGLDCFWLNWIRARPIVLVRVPRGGYRGKGRGGLGDEILGSLVRGDEGPEVERKG